MEELGHYRYRGARALVLLHARELRAFLEVWRRAKAQGVRLPETADEDYQSLQHVLHHVLRAARGYMVWMCKHLELPDPEIDLTPEPDAVEAEADAYLEHLLERWRLPLAGVPEARFEPAVYPASWGTPYSVEAMLEHAVMHPVRHSFQLEELREEAAQA